jgi:uncharacterized membrane protein YgdD (TMEM256/DUF423 family)
MRRALQIGAVVMGLSVILGAFGAHALKDHLSERMLQNWQTGVHYQMIHGLAILIVGLLLSRIESKWLNRAVSVFTFGIVFFSGSLYTMALTDTLWLGAITPIGGVLFILGWIYLLLAARTIKN